MFDCDGTLADTMPTHYLAWVAMLADHGIEFPEAQFYALGGMPTEGIIRLLAAEQGVAVGDVAAMSHDKEQRYLAMIERVRPHPSVLGIAARHRGVLPMGVGSGGEHWLVERTLAAIGATGWFDAIVGADETERHKPDPDVFLEVAHRLRVPASGCVVFEDTDLGLEAARRAGMLGVDVRPLIAFETAG